MKTRTMLLLMAAIATSLVACSGDDEEGAKQPSANFRPLTIEVAENSLRDGDASSRTTRAQITTMSTLTKFYLDYAYKTTLSSASMTMTVNGQGEWTGGYWPDVDDDPEVAWYAHSDGTLAGTADAPYIDFTVEELASKQKDLLVATASSTYAGCNGRLHFTFDHACSALRFYVKKSTNLADYTLQVNSVTLHNVVKKGYYDLTSSTWQPMSSFTSNYTLYSVDAPGMTLASDSYTLLNANENDFLFMIPQTLTPWNPAAAAAGNSDESYLEIAFSLSDAESASSATAYVPFAANFEQGKIHDVKIIIGKNVLLDANGQKIVTN